MKGKLSRFISCLLVMSLLVGIIAYAEDGLDGSSSDTTVNAGENANNAHDGWCDATPGFGFRIGLARCVNEELVYDLSDQDAKAHAVQVYNSKYYMRPEGETVIMPINVDYSVTANYRGSDSIPASSAPACIEQTLLEIVSNSPGRYTVVGTNGAISIPPDKEIITELMDAFASLGPVNAGLVEQWRQEEYSLELAAHPVVICIEAVGRISEGGHISWWSASDYAYRLGNTVGQRLLSTDISGYGTGVASKTCDAIADFAGYRTGGSKDVYDSWPYRFTKRMFGVAYYTNTVRAGTTDVYSRGADMAWATLTDQHLGVNGCTVVAIGGDTEGIHGSYTWHINASRLPANSEGYQEDNTADSVGDKTIGVGAVNIKQSNIAQWQEWIMQHGGPFTIDIQKYWTVGGNFTIQYNEVVGQRISSSTNTLSSSETEKQYTVDADTLFNYLKNGSDLDINGMTGGSQDVLGGSPLGNQYRVAYATTVDIIAGDGTVQTLTNSQVHFAIYGEDNDKTYKFNQILQQGKSQVKQGDGGLDTEEYEAMSGTPTTKDLFVTQGGEQFLVQLQYRYVDETYLRKYELKAKEPYPNYMYYYTSGGSSGLQSTTGGKDDGKDYDAYLDAVDTKFDDAITALTDKLGTFNRSIENNYGAKDAFVYEVCAPSVGTAHTDAIRWVGGLSLGDGDSIDKSKEFVYCKTSSDLDSTRNRDVRVTVKIKSNNEYTDGMYDSDGDGQDDREYDSWSVSYTYSITVDYGDFTPNRELKDLNYDNVLEQRYFNVRYLDIVECQVWRMEKGQQTGISYILAEPTEPVLDMAVSQMGYSLYDSTQTGLRSWNASTKQWESEDANDLNVTKRLLNSYNEATLRERLGNYLGDVTIVSTEDEVIVEYDMENGGRSHYSYEAYFARIAGNMFYEDSSGANPYPNYIKCCSDVFDINTGNSVTNGHETFCFNQWDSERVRDINPLEQYIMTNDGSIYSEFRDKTFSKGVPSSEVEGAMGSKDGFQDAAYLGGRVQLAIMDSEGDYATKYNKVAIAENDNPYTFYPQIPEVGGITWVGYRGNYMTDSSSHEPILGCISDWTPERSYALMDDGYYGQVWSDGDAVIELVEDMAPAKSEFPHMEGLNVNRTQDNNRYTTGYASILYAQAVTIDHTELCDVLPLAPMYSGANLGVQSDLISATSPGCATRATYDNTWTTPNDVVIFNPSTAEDAYIKQLTKYVPDLAGVGGDDMDYPIRDQRVSGYYVGTNKSNGVFAEDGTLDIGTDYLPTSTYKKMREISMVNTSYYTMEKDYNTISTSYERHGIVSVGSTYTAPITADYTFQVYDNLGNCSAIRVRLQEGDKVRNVEGTLYKVANNAVVTWDDYITEHNIYYNQESGVVDFSLDRYKAEVFQFHNYLLDRYSMDELCDIQGLDYSEDSYRMIDACTMNDRLWPDYIVDEYNERAEAGYREFIDALQRQMADDNITKVTPTRMDTYFLTELSDVKAGDVLHLHYNFEDHFADSTRPFDVNLIVNDPTAIDVKYAHTVNGYEWDYYIEFKKDCTVERVNVNFNVDTTLESLRSGQYMFEFVDTFLMSTGNAYSSPANKSTTIDFVYLNNRSCAYNGNIADYEVATYSPSGDIVPYRFYATYRESEVQYVIKQSSSKNPHIVYNSNWKYYVVGWKTENGITIKSPVDTLLDVDATVLKWPAGGTITVGELKDQACLVRYNGNIYLTTRDAGLDHNILQTGMRVSSYDVFTFASSTDELSTEEVGVSSNVTYPLQPGRTGTYLFKQYVYEFFFSCTSGVNANGYLYDVKYSTNPIYRFDMNDTSPVYDTSISHTESWECDWEEITQTMNSNAFGLHRVDFNTDATFLSLDDSFKVHYSNIGNYQETDHHNSGAMNVDLGYGWVDGLDTITWIQTKYVEFPFDYYTFGWNETYGVVDPSVTYDEYINGIDPSKHVGDVSARLVFHNANSSTELGYYEGDSGPADNEGHYIDFGSNCSYDYAFWVCLSSNETRGCTSILNSSNINNNYDLEANKQENNRDTPPTSFWRYANAMRQHITGIVGRIGNLTMLDTGDYRFSDTFKTTDPNADWLVYGLIKKLSPYSNKYDVPSTQKSLLLDPWDVRGIGSIESLLSDKYAGYTGYAYDGYSTYDTQWHKVGDKTRISSLPLTSQFNDHDALKLTQQKIGYSNLLTLDSIGNYYGSNGQFASNADMEGEAEQVNSNGDWSNQKIQIRPYYIAIDISDPSNIVSYPVDVYMKTGDSYEMINSGSTSTKTWMNVMYNNHYNMYLENNTEDEDPVNGTYKLDSNMLRRMVTDQEAKITYSVIKDWTGDGSSETEYRSMLTNPDTLSGHAWDILGQYCYGNGQYLFLRDRNRTFVGANSIALNYEEGAVTNTTKYKSHAQMWYFDLGLPTSAVFMKTGEPFSLDRIVNDEKIFILSCVDVYGLGQVWDLHYKSPVSLSEIELNGVRIPPSKWNPSIDKLPWLVPVTFYDSSTTTAKDDLTTEGTH